MLYKKKIEEIEVKVKVVFTKPSSHHSTVHSGVLYLNKQDDYTHSSSLPLAQNRMQEQEEQEEEGAARAEGGKDIRRGRYCMTAALITDH